MSIHQNKALTNTQKRLIKAIKKHELCTGKFCTAPQGSHMGMSNIREYQSNKIIHSGFQQRTFWELVNRNMIIQTLFCGYRLADGLGGASDLSPEEYTELKQRS